MLTLMCCLLPAAPAEPVPVTTVSQTAPQTVPETVPVIPDHPDEVAPPEANSASSGDAPTAAKTERFRFVMQDMADAAVGSLQYVRTTAADGSVTLTETWQFRELRGDHTAVRRCRIDAAGRLVALTGHGMKTSFGNRTTSWKMQYQPQARRMIMWRPSYALWGKNAGKLVPETTPVPAGRPIVAAPAELLRLLTQPQKIGTDLHRTVVGAYEWTPNNFPSVESWKLTGREPFFPDLTPASSVTELDAGLILRSTVVTIGYHPDGSLEKFQVNSGAEGSFSYRIRRAR